LFMIRKEEDNDVAISESESLPREWFYSQLTLK